jgi:hypothetical protein
MVMDDREMNANKKSGDYCTLKHYYYLTEYLIRQSLNIVLARSANCVHMALCRNAYDFGPIRGFITARSSHSFALVRKNCTVHCISIGTRIDSSTHLFLFDLALSQLIRYTNNHISKTSGKLLAAGCWPLQESLHSTIYVESNPAGRLTFQIQGIVAVDCPGSFGE